MVPPIILFLAKHPVVSKFDLSSITKLISGAAPLGDSLTEEVMERLKAPVCQGKIVHVWVLLVRYKKWYMNLEYDVLMIDGCGQKFINLQTFFDYFLQDSQIYFDVFCPYPLFYVGRYWFSLQNWWKCAKQKRKQNNRVRT